MRGFLSWQARTPGSPECSWGYDNQRLEALQAAVERLEGGKTFDPKYRSDNVSRIFQDPTEQSFARSEDPAKESATSH